MTAAAGAALDRAAFQGFAESGFFVQRAAFPESACDALLVALSALIERAATARLEGRRPARSFWELLPASAHGEEVFFDDSQGPLEALPARAWEGRAMRIGHGLHLTDPAFVAFCRRPELAAPLRGFAHVAALLSAGASPEEAACAAIETPDPARLVQSAVIYKQPRSEIVQFGFHRDAAYLPVEPESLVLAFVALDATTPENGCLALIPGSHTEPLGLRLRLDPTGFTPVGREPRPAAERALLLPMPRGAIAFVHGRTQHASEPNRSPGPRRALLVHAMNERSRLDPGAWVKAPPSGLPPL